MTQGPATPASGNLADAYPLPFRKPMAAITSTHCTEFNVDAGIFHVVYRIVQLTYPV